MGLSGSVCVGGIKSNENNWYYKYEGREKERETWYVRESYEEIEE